MDDNKYGAFADVRDAARAAAAEKLAAFLTLAHLQREAAKGSRKDFDKEFMLRAKFVVEKARGKND
jgi:hypothetical protein